MREAEDSTKPAKRAPRKRTAKPAPGVGGAGEQILGETLLPAGLTWEMVAVRAYHISLSSESSSDEENWLRAERELLAELMPKA